MQLKGMVVVEIDNLTVLKQLSGTRYEGMQADRVRTIELKRLWRRLGCFGMAHASATAIFTDLIGGMTRPLF